MKTFFRSAALALALSASLFGCSSEENGEDAAAEGDEALLGIPSPSRAVLLAPGCTAKVSIAQRPAWVFFTRPDKPCVRGNEAGQDAHILNELTRLINSVPSGGRIDGHIFSISVDSVAAALLNAQKRGVSVWISTNGAVADSTDSAKTNYIDKLDHHVYCRNGSGDGCIASGSGSISHSKLFTFSRATLPDGQVANDVSWFGSANQTYHSGMSLYNNTITISDPALTSKFRRYLDDLYYQRGSSDYYDPDSGRGHYQEATAHVYVSPENDSDIVENRLDDIKPGSGCEIRVMQASIRDSRLKVVTRLIWLKQNGCKVSVVADTVEPIAKFTLKAAGITPRHQLVHDKVFVVKAKYESSEGKDYYRVYTGSHNLSGSANDKYDEIFVKLAPEFADRHPLYDAFIRHFDDAYETGKSI